MRIGKVIGKVTKIVELGPTTDELWVCARQIFWRDVDARQKLKIYLAYEMDGNIERAAYVTLKVDGFPFDEVYEVDAFREACH